MLPWFVIRAYYEEQIICGITSEGFESEEPEVMESGETDSEIEVQVQVTVADKTEADEEEPDWGDAFAESGDEMDEETKTSFDSEAKG